ncbi:MAG: 5'/3'-nucleotidase SurE [Myxococcales bacterium]|nr:5'/3'-nucleotidase SurE [Myxococcales bacterium]
MRILVSNDDGVIAEGLRCLAETMAPLGEVWVVAPEAEQSAASHALSLHRPLRIKKVRERWFTVDGTPSDCSYLAINHLLKDRKPSLMVSGINHGANLADDVTYSGTVAAAMEASILGVPSIAFSLVSRRQFDFTHAARFAGALAEAVLALAPSRLLLNVNVPGDEEPKGYAITRLGKHTWGYDVVENVDPRGRKYYWIGGTEYRHEDVPGSDCNAVLKDRLISVTPLQLDLTDGASVPALRELRLPGFTAV